MGKVTGFLEIDRRDRTYEPVEKRLKDYKEFYVPLGDSGTRNQAARCMDCGIPFCHTGCPVNNQIPDWNDLVYHDDWRAALRNLQSTNNFSKPLSAMAASIVLIVTGSSMMLSVQLSSQGAGQTRPVNSGKLLVDCRLRSAARQSS